MPHQYSESGFALLGSSHSFIMIAYPMYPLEIRYYLVAIIMYCPGIR
jgi:hypothetical protein